MKRAALNDNGLRRQGAVRESCGGGFILQWPVAGPGAPEPPVSRGRGLGGGRGGAYTPGCVLTLLPSCSDSHAHIHYLEDCILHHPAQEGHFLIASMLHPVFSRLPTNNDLLSAALIRKDCRAHLDRGPVKIESSQKVSGADAAFHDRVCLHSVNIVRWQETTAEGGERDQSQGVRHEHP